MVLAIDGSFGEGGGQIVRSSVALSLVTGTPIEIRNIRAGRAKPGLLRQHLTAVEAARAVGQAEVQGARFRSRRLVFRPATVTPGQYRFDVGTAGSATLVLQTVLPALVTAPGPSTLVLEGGTHNPMAPPFDFLARTYLPLLNRMGPRVEARLQRPGFYPAGGGRLVVEVVPAGQLGRLELRDRGRITGRRVRAVVANLPERIAQRECRTIAQLSGWEADCFRTEVAREARGPGNVVMIEVQSEALTEVFTGFGQKGVKAERVASQVWQQADRYLRAAVPVGEHLADQLLLLLGLAAGAGAGGGAFRTLDLTRHSTTHAEILRRFLAISVAVDVAGRDDVLVRVEPSGPPA